MQEVLLVLGAEVERTGAEPEKVRGFIKRTVEKKVSTYKQLSRLKCAGEEVPSDLRATGTEADPEGTAELNEQLRKVEQYAESLPKPWVEAMRCVYGAGMSPEEAAKALGLHRSTVYDYLAAAAERLREKAQESERAAAERAGRRPPGA